MRLSPDDSPDPPQTGSASTPRHRRKSAANPIAPSQRLLGDAAGRVQENSRLSLSLPRRTQQSPTPLPLPDVCPPSARTTSQPSESQNSGRVYPPSSINCTYSPLVTSRDPSENAWT